MRRCGSPWPHEEHQWGLERFVCDGEPDDSWRDERETFEDESHGLTLEDVE